MLSNSSTVPHPDANTSVLGLNSSPSPQPEGQPTVQTDVPLRPATDGRTGHRSIQFDVAGSEASLGKRPVSSRKGNLGRIPSPPPPSSYNRGVSFDTFDNRDATDFSLTLNYKHKDYKSTRSSRTFLCGTDQNDYSDFALEWLIDELVDDGDEIVCLRVVEKDSKIASDSSVEEGRYRQEAEKLLEQVIAKNKQEEKAISLVMELAVGKVQEIIQRMIQIYEPAVLIVGTRGRSLGGMQGLLPGSVSKYCLQQSPIPVIVVRPSIKREKKKQKRLADPSRKSYDHILKMNEAKGGRLFEKSESANSSTSKLPHEEEKQQGTAAATASTTIAGTKTIPSVDGSADSQNHQPDHNRGSPVLSNDSSDDDSPIAGKRSSVSTNPESPTVDFSEVVLKSPTLGEMESPNSSEDEDVDGDAGDDGYMDENFQLTSASAKSVNSDPSLTESGLFPTPSDDDSSDQRDKSALGSEIRSQ